MSSTDDARREGCAHELGRWLGMDRTRYRVANAVMAKADEETAELRAENARLRAELEQRKADAKRAYAKLGWTYDGN